MNYIYDELNAIDDERSLHESEGADFLQYQGKPFTAIFRELVAQENDGVKPPYHVQNYSNSSYNVMIWYIPEKDYGSRYKSIFEHAAKSLRDMGARCDIAIKPGYSNNKWGDDASHTVWVYTNRAVFEGSLSNPSKTEVKVPWPFDKHFSVKTNITDKPFSVPGYEEKVLAWLSPVSDAAKEYMNSATCNGRACLIDAEDFPVCSYERGRRRGGGLFPIDIEDLEN